MIKTYWIYKSFKDIFDKRKRGSYRQNLERCCPKAVQNEWLKSRDMEIEIILVNNFYIYLVYQYSCNQER